MRKLRLKVAPQKWSLAFVCLLLTCAIGLLAMDQALAADESKKAPTLNWSAVNSTFLELRPNNLPKKQPFVQWLLFDHEFFKYDVGLETGGKVPAECRWRTFKKNRARMRPDLLNAAYFQDCEKAIQTGPTDTPRNLYRSLMISMPVEDHPYLKRVILHLPNNFRLPGLLALKDTQYRRPLVIFRAGIFGNSLDLIAERFLLIQIFEQAGFNVLFLDSMMSAESAELNTQYSAGGLDEGIQNYQIARQVTNPNEPLSRLVGAVHLMGLSMGGHSLWMTMMLNQLNKPLFSSAVGVCPLVQFEKTFSEHQRRPFFFFEMNVWSYLRMSVFRERVPGLSLSRFLVDSFDWLKKHYRGPITEDGMIRYPRELLSTDGRPNNFAKANDLGPLIRQIKTPVTVFSTRHDEIVPFDFNGQELVDLQKAQPDGPIQIFPVAEGTHCSFPGAYDWDEFSDLLVDQFRTSQLPELWGKPLQWSRREIVTNNPTGVGDVKIRNVIANVGERSIRVDLGREGTPQFVEIPISQIDWATTETIRNWTEARAIIRWARHNIEVISEAKTGRVRLTWVVAQ